MSYEFSYSIASIVFLGITCFFYFGNSRIHNFEDKFFTYLLCSSMVALVFDLMGALSDIDPTLLPVWGKYLVNILGVGATHLCYPCFCLYLFKANDEKKFITPLGLSATFIPFAIDAVLLLASPFSHSGIFYINESGIYTRGLTYAVLYASSAIYFVTAFVLVLVYYRNMERNRNRLILLSFIIIIGAAGLQYFFPRYLLITSATALAVCVLHLTLQNPVERIDPSTGCFNRTQLPKLLRRYHESHATYTLLLFYIGVSGEAPAPGAPETKKALLRRAAIFLRSSFSGNAVVYMDSSQFTVVCQRSVNPQKLRSVRERFAAEFGAAEHISPPELGIAVLRSEEKTDADAVLMMLDYLFKRLHSEPATGVLVADESFRQACFVNTILASTIDTLLTEENSLLRLSEFYDSNGELAGLKASLSVKGERFGEVGGERLIQKADESGLGWKYFSVLLRKLSAEAYRLNDGIRAEISIPVSVCLTRFAAQRIDECVRAASLRRDMLVLSLSERDIADSQTTLQENIRDTADLGYMLRVTHFAAGFTNVALLISMPVDDVELDADLSSPDESGDKAKMLNAVIGLLKGLNKRVICSNVSGGREAQILYEYGADLIEYKAIEPNNQEV